MLKPSGRWADLINDLIPDAPNDDGCAHCGKEFTRSAQPNHVFCSRSCKQMAWLARQPKPEAEPHQCVTCKTIFTPTNLTGRKPKTCSEPCRIERNRTYHQK